MSAGLYDEVFQATRGSSWLSNVFGTRGDAATQPYATPIAPRLPTLILAESLLNHKREIVRTVETELPLSAGHGCSITRWIFDSGFYGGYKLRRIHMLDDGSSERYVVSNTIDPYRLIALHIILCWAKTQSHTLYQDIKSRVETESRFEFSDSIERWVLIYKVWGPSSYFAHMSIRCEANASVLAPHSYGFNTFVNDLTTELYRRPPGECAITIWQVRQESDCDL